MVRLDRIAALAGEPENIVRRLRPGRSAGGKDRDAADRGDVRRVEGGEGSLHPIAWNYAIVVGAGDVGALRGAEGDVPAGGDDLPRIVQHPASECLGDLYRIVGRTPVGNDDFQSVLRIIEIAQRLQAAAEAAAAVLDRNADRNEWPALGVS